VPKPDYVNSLPFGVVAAVRITLKRDVNGQWSEIGSALHLYCVSDCGKVEVVRADKGDLIRALLDSTIRKTADPESSMPTVLLAAEQDIIKSLWKPTDQELPAGIRHAVLPLFAAVITD
jgi:hypothetical protein